MVNRNVMRVQLSDPITKDKAGVSSDGNLMVANGTSGLEIAKGNVAGTKAINKFGHNPSVTTGTDPEDVWGGGGLYAFYPTTAQSLELVSDSTDDDAAGIGALTVQVYGLDENFLEVDETVILDGIVPVALTENTYIRMYRAIVLTAGTSETNVGNIFIQIAAGGTVGAYIGAGDGQTQQAIYTVPEGKSAYFTKGYVGISKAGGAAAASAEFKWKARPNNGYIGAWQTQGQMEVVTSGSSHWQYEYGVPNGPIPARTDIRIECVEVSATLGVVGGFDLILVDD